MDAKKRKVASLVKKLETYATAMGLQLAVPGNDALDHVAKNLDLVIGHAAKAFAKAASVFADLDAALADLRSANESNFRLRNQIDYFLVTLRQMEVEASNHRAFVVEAGRMNSELRASNEALRHMLKENVVALYPFTALQRAPTPETRQLREGGMRDVHGSDHSN